MGATSWSPRDRATLSTLSTWNARIALERAAADKFSKELGMCSLKGSERQVAWALTIRYKAFKRLFNLGGNPDAGKAIVAVLNLEHQAKWWIEARDFNPISMFDSIVTNYPKEFKIVQSMYTTTGA